MRDTRLLRVRLDDAQRDLPALVSELQEDRQPTLITAGGHPAAVLISIDAYDRLSRELEVLRRLALGEIESTVGYGFSLAQVSEECDLLLDEN